MSHSSAYTEIGKYVDKYLLKKKLPQDDYFLLLQHTCDCFRNISLRHSNKVVTTKVTVSSLGIIEMPQDMIGFSCLYVAIGGEMWSFTKKSKKVMTTTTTLGIEGQDSEIGEGTNVQNDMYWGLGGRGGVNSYYFNIDWSARRIFCDGFKSDTAVLVYTSSGLVVSGTTYVDVQCEPVIDAYLDWQREIINTRSMGLLDRFEKYYNDRLFELRLLNFMPSRDEIQDAWDSSSTQGVQR